MTRIFTTIITAFFLTLMLAPGPTAMAQNANQKAAPQNAPPAAAKPVVRRKPKSKADEVTNLKERIRVLEQQITDLQVVYGTMETFSRDGGAPAAEATIPKGMSPRVVPLSSEITDRLDGMETQIRALSGQVERLGLRRQGMNPTPPPNPGLGQAFSNDNEPAQNGFGAKVTRNEAPPLPNFQNLQHNGPDDDMPLDPMTKPFPGAEDPPARRPHGSKALYEEAYGKLLRRDYAAAQTTFAEFLRLHPQDSLAGNAQFWLGESFYVRSKYREAAEHFLKGYKKYQNSAKAPDSLLKLAMSLKELGQKDAACTTFLELNTKFPNAPGHVRQRARSERLRAGC